MERYSLFPVLLAIVVTLAGCGQAKTNNYTDTAKTATVTLESAKSGQTEQAQLPQQAVSSFSEANDEPFYGEWEISKELAFAPASTYSSDEIKAILGKTLTFSKESVTCFGDKKDYLDKVADDPTYTKTVVSRQDFEANNKVTFDSLGITGDSVIQIDASDGKGNGAILYVKDKNTLILAGGGVYLELKRKQLSTEQSLSVLEAYRGVLLNSTEFYSTDSQKKVYFNDFLTDKKIYETEFKASSFTVLDMDGDNVPEVVVGLSISDVPQFYEVLHFSNNSVYGYLFTNRVLGDLKADGTFIFSSGAADTGVGRIKFDSDSDDYSIEILGCSKSSQGENDITIAYFINNKTVGKEDFEAFIQKQTEKTGAKWYEFSQSNIDAELSDN